MTPVTKAAAGEHRKITGPAGPRACPSAPSACAPRIASTGQASSWSAWVSGVAIQPGAMALTRMPSAAQAIGEALRELRNAAFAGAIGGREARAEEAQHRGDVNDAPPLSASSGRQAVQTRMVPVRLTSSTWAKVSRSYSALRRMIPAALTRISKTVQPTDQTVDRGGVGHIKLGGRAGRGWRASPLGGGQTAAVACSRLSQSRRDGGADAAVPPVTSA